MSLPGSRVSPVARMLAVPTMPSMMNGTAAYRMVMKGRIVGSMSAGAPRSVNSGSMVSTPTIEQTSEISSDRIRLSVDKRRARAWSSLPRARATTDEVPAPRPMATLVTIIRIGKPKL